MPWHNNGTFSKTDLYIVDHTFSTYINRLKVSSASTSSYPAVGSALHQWVFFINDRITALCPDWTTLLRPRGWLHWPGEEKRRMFVGIRKPHTTTNAREVLYNLWCILLTQSSRNQSHDRSTCHSLCGKILLVCSICLCMSRCLWKKQALQWHRVSISNFNLQAWMNARLFLQEVMLKLCPGYKCLSFWQNT